MIELIFLGGVLGIGSIITHVSAWGENGRFPRPTYGALVGWWYGAFTRPDAAMVIANMIDSDYNCETFKNFGTESFPTLTSESLKTRINIPITGLSELTIVGKDDKRIKYDVSMYDDYVLVMACKKWVKRNKEKEALKLESKCQEALDERINKNYIDTISMIEKRILNTNQETAPQLMAMLEAPPMPDETKKIPQMTPEREKELCAKYDPTYDPFPWKDIAQKKKMTKTKSKSKTLIEGHYY